MSHDELLTSVRGGLGVITLNRPQAVNALSYPMIGLFQEALTEFEHNAAVHAVVVRGAGDRGLCAGGDVVSLHNYAVTGDVAGAVPFFREEYHLDHRISVYPKPYIVIMNGLVLGGGVGIAAPGSHRIATDSTRLGMPEAGIGFSPDVGGPYYLARTPAGVGNYLALTGTHISGPDTVHIGMADALVPDARIEQLIDQLSGISAAHEVDAVIAAFDTPQPSALAKDAAWIQTAFDQPTVEQILAAVEATADDDNPRAQQALKALRRNAPLGMKVGLEAIRRAKDLTLAETLAQDLRTTLHAIAGTELAEGIRAQLIDKDRNPQWDPATLAEVTDATVAAFFAPVEGIQDLGIEA